LLLERAPQAQSHLHTPRAPMIAHGSPTHTSRCTRTSRVQCSTSPWTNDHKHVHVATHRRTIIRTSVGKHDAKRRPHGRTTHSNEGRQLHSRAPKILAKWDTKIRDRACTVRHANVDVPSRHIVRFGHMPRNLNVSLDPHEFPYPQNRMTM